MEENKFYATGKRKNGIARIWMKPGSGHITVNGQALAEYFDTPSARLILQSPLDLTQTRDNYDIKITVRGGGFGGQAGAARHGISKALAQIQPELREPLKNNGFLIRDARVKERKKYGKRGARASYQYSKR